MSETFTVYVCPDCGSRALNQGDDCLHSQGEDEHLRAVRRQPVEATWMASIQAEPLEGGAHIPDGSGGAPQLDERALEAAWREAWGLGWGYSQPHAKSATEKIIRAYLAASPGAGELDLTDDEIRALAESAERGADFLDIQGVHALTGVAKLRVRLDRKDDE